MLNGIKDENGNKTVTMTITKIMKDVDSNKNSPIYPGELHRAMLNRYHVVAKEQRDVHETFMIICSDGDKTDINDVVASHFHMGSQICKTCRESGSLEVGMPETHTTLNVSVLNGINDLEKAVETNINQDITVRCAKCGKDTTHTRSSLLFVQVFYSFQKHWRCALHDLK